MSNRIFWIASQFMIAWLAFTQSGNPLVGNPIFVGAIGSLAVVFGWFYLPWQHPKLLKSVQMFAVTLAAFAAMAILMRFAEPEYSMFGEFLPFYALGRRWLHFLLWLLAAFCLPQVFSWLGGRRNQEIPEVPGLGFQAWAVVFLFAELRRPKLALMALPLYGASILFTTGWLLIDKKYRRAGSGTLIVYGAELAIVVLVLVWPTT